MNVLSDESNEVQDNDTSSEMSDAENSDAEMLPLENLCDDNDGENIVLNV